MAEVKMKENDRDVMEFIEAVEHSKRREDAYRLLEIFTKVTGKQPKMWGTSIIGFGSYHYKYESGHEGDAPVVAFSPRKARHSLYLLMEGEKRDELLKGFGKHKTSKACIYVNELEDINIEVLEELILETVKFVEERYGTKRDRP